MAVRHTRKSNIGRHVGVTLAVVGLATAAAGCGGGGSVAGSSTGGSQHAGSYSVGFPASYVQHFIPGQAGDSGLDEAIWTPLTTINVKTGQVEDAVAQSVSSTDQVHWTIMLKHGWTFQNGTPVTAQSFADSWNATAYGPNAMGFNYLMDIFAGYTAMNPTKGKPSAKTLSGVKVVNPYELKVTLTSPLSTFPYVLAGTTFAPMPAVAFKNLSAFDKLPVGDGPYQMAAPGIANGAQQITLHRYAKYAGVKGGTPTIVVRTYQSDATAYTSFQSGALDLTSVTGNDLTAAHTATPSQVVTQSSPAVEYLGFPLADPQFSNIKVREAFSLAINRPAIVKALLGGFGVPAQGIAPKSLPGGGTATCTYCSYDPAKARQLLAEAGGWKGSLTLWTQQDPTMQTVLQAILNQLRTNLGIKNITIQTQQLGQLYSNLAAHKLKGAFLLYMGASYPSTYSLAEDLFATGSATNVTGYSSPAFTAKLKAAASAASAGQVTSLTNQAISIAFKDAPLAPLFYPVNGLVYANGLKNVAVDYLGDPDLQAVTK